MQEVLSALNRAKAVTWDYSPAPLARVRYWEQKGAKKGDAVIVAHLEAAEVPYFISENRHFLTEVPDLPFEVLTSSDALLRLG